MVCILGDEPTNNRFIEIQLMKRDNGYLQLLMSIPFCLANESYMGEGEKWVLMGAC